MSELLSSLPLTIFAIICFGLVVFCHELGHFLAAISCGMPVEEFSMGMGPQLFSKVHKGIRYSLRLLPIGAFVGIRGESDMEIVGDKPDTDEETMATEQLPSLQDFAVWKRMLMVVAGPFFNFILALLIFTSFAIYNGVPVSEPLLGEVFLESRAEEAGFRKDDLILSINGQSITSWNEAVEIINAAPEQNVDVVVKRNNEEVNLSVIPELSLEDSKGRIGISVAVNHFNFLASMQQGLTLTKDVVVMFYSSIAESFVDKEMPQFMGPVGLIQVTGDIARNGILDLIWFMAFISINLGIVNLLPIPPLDGARLVMLVVEGIRGKPLPLKYEAIVSAVGFICLFSFIAFITFGDIMRIFGG